MRSNYKRLGDYIVQKGQPNKELKYTNLLGINNAKYFVKAKTNLNGIDLSKYRVVERNQFAFNRATTRNGDKISIALRDGDTCIVSPSYRIFEVKDANKLDPQYLMMWFRRPEFDRYARFKSHGSAHEFFDYDEMCEVELPVPPIEKQREIVREYNVLNDRISLNEQLTQKLRDTAQAIYKQWFVDFEFPIPKEYAHSIGMPELEGKPYKSSGGEMEYCEETDELKPSIWRSAKIINAFELQRGFDLPRQSRKSGSIPIVSANGGTELHDTAKVTAPGVVTGRSGTLGKVFFVEEDFWPLNTTLWVKNFNAFTPIYTYFFLSNLNLSEYSTGSAVPTLNRNDVHDDFCVIPAAISIEFFDKYAKALLKLIREKTEEKQILNQMLMLVNTKMSKA